MKVLTIGNYYNHSTNYARKQQQNALSNSLLRQSNDEVAFKGVKRALSSTAGGVLGAAAGGAIMGGGTLAGAAALAATGPIGLIAVGAYALGGLLAGSWMGDTAGEIIEEKDK